MGDGHLPGPPRSTHLHRAAENGDGGNAEYAEETGRICLVYRALM